MTKLINLTPHAISVQAADGTTTTFESAGVARVTSTDLPAGELNGFPVVTTQYGEVTGLGPMTDGVVYVVSAMVLDRVVGRTDVVAPDSGPTAVRNEKGQIVAVRQFRAVAAK